jgi:hypothetical protein
LYTPITVFIAFDCLNVNKNACNKKQNLMSNLIICNTKQKSEEVLKEIKKLKNNKAPGEDGLPGELYKTLSSQLLPVIVKLFNTIFHTGIFPEC